MPEEQIKVWVNPQDGYLETEEIPGAKSYLTTAREMRRYNQLRSQQIREDEQI